MLRLKSLAPAAYPATLFVIAWASIAFSRESELFAAVWPVNAVALAMLVRWAITPSRRAYVLGFFTLVVAAANLVAGAGVPLALTLTVFNVAEVVIAALLIRGATDPIAGLGAFARFLGGAVLAAPLLAGLGAAAALSLLSPEASFITLFVRWALADSLGMAIVGSFLLMIGRPGSRAASRGEVLRFVAAQALLALACIPVMLLSDKPLLGLLFPLVIVAAISHRQLGAVTGVAIFAVFTVAGSLMGNGAAGLANMAGYDPLVITQLVVASMAFSVLPVAALLRRLDKTAAEAETARSRAEELNEIKTRLLAHVSHEIRSPLTGVTTLAELMRDGALGELTPTQRESIEQIAKSGAAVAALARDLVDAAAIQTGKATVQLEEVRAGEAMRSAVALAGFRAAEYGAVIQIGESDADGEIVWADPLRVRQILINLLVNAAKYGGFPPKVRITARRTADGSVRFLVEDNGKGLGFGGKEVLFRDFDRLGAERADLDGAGLGLALSQEIARLQNGRLGMDQMGALGRACFWLELPLARQTVAAA